MEKEQPLGQDRFDRKRVEDCRRLFIKFNGTDFKAIENAMRKLGHHSFDRRLLYGYRRGERFYPGWVERHGFERSLEEAALGTPPPKRSITWAREFASFQDWLRSVRPDHDWDLRHQMPLYKKLERVESGDCNRLAVFMPPRHGKSELVTCNFAAWLLRNDPSKNIIVGSYNQRLANRFSRKIKRALVDDWYLHGNDGEEEEKGRGDAQKGEPSASAGGPSDAESQNRRVTASARRRVDPPDAKDTHRAYPNGSPFPFASKRRANTDAEWETSHGGGLRAVGVGSGVTGFGADFIIVDDPIKSRAEAESATYRDRVWEWFNDDLYTRLEPDGRMILIQTRWHEDDLAGRLLREAAEEGGEKWEIIDMPAIAEPQLDRKRAADDGTVEKCDGDTLNSKLPSWTGGVPASGGVVEPRNASNKLIHKTDHPVSSQNPRTATPPGQEGSVARDPIGRAPGEALWPERFDVETLDRIRRKLGTYSFAALYQQRPVPADGGLFKREWFNIIARAPEGLKWKRATDPGILSTASSDYTASFRVAFDRQNNLYIDGGFRKQMEYPELRRYVLGRMREERDTIEHCIERSAHGHALVQDLARERSIRGRPLRGIEVREGKVARALGWIALAEQGKVFLTRGGWNRDFVDECIAFPAGSHDDQIDAVSIGIKASRQLGGGFYTF